MEEEATVEEAAPMEEEVWDSRKMDPKDTLWDDGPNFGQINAWKDQHKGVYVSSLTPEDHYVWRTLKRNEYRDLVKALETAINAGSSQALANMDNEENIAELCVLYPPYKRNDQSDQLAGAAGTLSQQILEASGFVSLEIREL